MQTSKAEDDRATWIRLQKLADEKAKANLLKLILETLGLDEYIAQKIAEHEEREHGGN